MDQRRTHYLFAGLSFLIALITYGMTMQPTIPFWDCGEFGAAAIGLGVPHPPGAPHWKAWHAHPDLHRSYCEI
jgi:hypothetical protein